MLAVRGLGEGAYGAAILDVLASVRGGTPSSGALSTTLDRLEAKGLLVSRYERGDERRGGHPRRVVALTPAGAEALKLTEAAFTQLRERRPPARA